MALSDPQASRADTGERPPALRSIVVPVDGTRESARAVALGAELASNLGIELTILSVVASFRPEAPARVARLRELLSDVPPEVERKVVQAPSVARTIAEESEGGLVCLATSAEPFDEEGIRHSVADQLVAAATSPVIVLGPQADETPTIGKVVVAVDPDHDQKGLVRWATRLAYQLSLPIEFLHVTELDPGETVADRLLAASEDGLLAMGSHGRTEFRRLIEGSTGAAVIPRATQPILVVGPGIDAPR